jgi:hypothetical protein
MTTLRFHRLRLAAVTVAVLAASASGAGAQDVPAWGRVSFFTTASQLTPDEGDSRSFSEFIGTVNYHSATPMRGSGVEFGVDTRGAAYGTGHRDPRYSIYDAWVGSRLMDGALRVRVGHMWLNDLGGLGAIAGGMAEYRRPFGKGYLRVVGFGGLEPESYTTGYVKDVKRYGGYASFDGGGLRKHVIGYVQVKNASLVERSVISTTNYVPFGKKVFVYQGAEYDLQGPAGQGKGGLTYFFTSARATATSRVELQGTYHRGRSIDARTITEDQLAGRPISPKSLDGLLFESAGGRVTVTVAKGIRAFAGYARDRNNRDDQISNRTTAGGSVANLVGTGVDVTVSLSRFDRGTAGSYDSWWASAGRSLGSRVYVSGEYSSSAAVVRFAGSDGITIETRPHTDRFGGSAVVNVNRAISLLVTGEYAKEDTLNEVRILAGITYRLH